MSVTPGATLTDPFGRTISYLRMSVTDRCDLRCVYCMAEDMTFLPRDEVLSIEEMHRLASRFVAMGVSKIRLTGGEPLVRQGIVELVRRLSALDGLRDLCMTTNGTRLLEYAEPLKEAGLGRLNISLDTLQAERFSAMTRFGKIDKVLSGIDAAIAAGFSRIKLNCVALKNHNANEAADLVEYAVARGLDISFIEEMPLGKVSSHGRALEFISSAELRQQLSEQFNLLPSSEQSGGPARYWQVSGSQSKVGFISPHSNNFCSSCNRVRVTATGRLILCLGQEHSRDFRQLLRDNTQGDVELDKAIHAAIAIKPKEHHFDLSEDEPQVVRFMNLTGG